MMGMEGMGWMMRGMEGMGWMMMGGGIVIGVLIVVLLVLTIVALVKYTMPEVDEEQSDDDRHSF